MKIDPKFFREIKRQFLNRNLIETNQDWPNDINRALKYINENLFSHDLDVSFMRKQCNIPQKNFSGIFKYFIGYTPSSYIKSKRIECAKIILEEAPELLPIDTVSMEIGYRHLTTFHSAFKDKTNFTPKNFAILSKKKSK